MARIMKDSGIEWIGEIPEDWNVVKLKWFVKIKSGEYLNKNKFIDYGNVDVFGANAKLGNYDKSNIKKKTIITGRVGTLGNLDIKDNVWITDNVLAIDVMNANLNFVYYFLHILNYEELSSSTAQPLITASKLYNINFSFPTNLEQNKISVFLDIKTKEIYRVKSIIAKEIQILENYKKSMITEAVTKGLNKNVEMKDSGIEWIGEIPKHWKLVKGKYMFKQRNERGNKIDLILLSPSQKYGVIPQDLYEELSGMRAVKLDSKIELSNLKTIHKGDFCISLRSFQGGFEYSNYEGVVSPAYQVFYSFIDSCNEYYGYMFKEKGFIEKMNSYTMSLRDGKNISFNDFGNSYLPTPPLKEQKEISNYLDKKTKIIDETITSKQKQLEILEEYKKSLIFEYVTGKKEVEDVGTI